LGKQREANGHGVDGGIKGQAFFKRAMQKPLERLRRGMRARSAPDDADKKAGEDGEPVVFLIDWDDTLFPTTASTAGSVTAAEWKSLQIDLEAFLTTALRYGRVHIVTNSENGWVEMSVARHMPGLAPLIARIPVVSARSAFERKDHLTTIIPTAEEQTRWKFLAMLGILQREIQTTRAIPTLVQIGDSTVERAALLRIAARLPDLPPVKSIQLVQQPSAALLQRELHQLTPVVPLLARQQNTAVDVQLSPQ